MHSIKGFNEKMMNYTDKEMIDILTNISPLKFNEVVQYITQKLASKIYHYITSNGGRKEDVEEVLNDALLVAHEFAVEKKFKENTSILAFVYQVSKYKFNRHIRKEKKTPLVYVEQVLYNLNEESINFEIDETESTQIKELKKLIENLKPEDKETITDFYYKRMTMKQIATKNNLGSEQAARNKLYRIRERLKKHFKTENETTL